MAHHLVRRPDCPACELKLQDVHPDLVAWYRKVKETYPDTHISWGFRDQASQAKAFEEGKSKLCWPESPHNKRPSLAIDLFSIDSFGKALFSPTEMARIYHTIPGPIRWGGTFKSLGDMDHMELVQS